MLRGEGEISSHHLEKAKKEVQVSFGVMLIRAVFLG
jgi:hypothetical protein